MKQNETNWNKMKQNGTKWKTNWTHPFRKFSPVTPAIVFHPFKIGHMDTPPMATCLIACHVLATMWSSCVLFSAYLTSVVARQNITRSHKRRYYRTVWVVWGIPMRIIPTGRAKAQTHQPLELTISGGWRAHRGWHREENLHAVGHLIRQDYHGLPMFISRQTFLTCRMQASHRLTCWIKLAVLSTRFWRPDEYV